MKAVLQPDQPDQLDQVDRVFRAFSDRTRLRIMSLLHGRGEICVCDLMRVLELPQAKVSRHLAYLRRAELVDTRRDGQWVHYRLSKANGKVHGKLLECLRCCLAEVPQLQADRERMDNAACGTKPGDCC